MALGESKFSLRLKSGWKSLVIHAGCAVLIPNEMMMCTSAPHEYHWKNSSRESQ